MMKMINLKNKRGSTLVLALVLTMVLFIMGIAFISTTSIQRDMVANATDGQYVNDGVDVVVAKIKLELKKDLFEDKTNYTGFLQGVASYDYPDENNDWLASLTPEERLDDWDNNNNTDTYYCWPRISDLWGKFGGVKTNYTDYTQGGSDYRALWLNYHYDRDPFFVEDRNSDGFEDTPESYDFFNELSWRYMVEWDWDIPCRIVDNSETITDSPLPWGVAANQWGKNNNLSIGLYTFLSGINSDNDPYNDRILDILGVYFGDSVAEPGTNWWRIKSNGYRVSAPAWTSLPSTVYRIGPIDSPHGMRADADGDGVSDSRWVRLGQVNADGDYLYAAVRIIDNGGMINLNTALGKPGQLYNISTSEYNPYDGSYVDTATELDNWDGSSVSHIDAKGLVRPSESNIFGLYDDMNIGGFDTSFSNPAYAHDYAFARNMAACPYRNPRRFFDDPSGTYYDLALPGTNYNYAQLDLNEELELRNRNLVVSSVNSRVKTALPVTYSTGGGFSVSAPYYNYDESNTGGTCYYEGRYDGVGNWNWFDKVGLLLTGDPYNDLRSGDSSTYNDMYARRSVATTISKDRLVRPEFRYDDPDNTTEDTYYSDKNLLTNVTDLYNLDEFMTGFRRCNINVNVDSAGMVYDKDGDGVDENKYDLNQDDSPDGGIFDLITFDNVAAAYYMAIRSMKSSAASVNSEIRKRFGDTGTPVDYNSERLSAQFALNFRDYYDVESSAPELESVLELQGIQYDVNPVANSYDVKPHEEVYFGFESLDRISDEVLNISKIAFYIENSNPIDASSSAVPPPLDGDSTPNGRVPNGTYLAIELFNPSENDKANLTDYILLVLNEDNEVEVSIPFNSFDNSLPNLGILPTVTQVNSATNTMVVLLFDLSLGVSNESDYIYDPTPTGLLESYEYDFAGVPTDRVANTFGTTGDRYVFADVSTSRLLDPTSNANFITSDYSIVLVKKKPVTPDNGIADQLSNADNVYPCDSVDLLACADIFKRYREISVDEGTSTPFDGNAFDHVEKEDDKTAGPRDAFHDDPAGDGYIRVYYRRDVFGSVFNASNKIDGSCLLLPSYLNPDNNNPTGMPDDFNPWQFGYYRLSPSVANSTINPPNIGSPLLIPNDNSASDPIGTYSSTVAQMNVLDNTWGNYDSLVSAFIDDPQNTWTVQEVDDYNSWVGYSEIRGMLSGNYDFRQLYDRFTAGSKDSYWFSSIGQLQGILAVGARCVEIDVNGGGYASDNSFATGSTDKVFYEPFFHSLLKSKIDGEDNSHFAYNGHDLIGNPGRINLGDELFARIPEFMTVIDYSRDGIDNDGILVNGELPYDYNDDDIDQDGDGKDAPGALPPNDIDTDEDIASRNYNDDGIDQDGDGIDADPTNPPGDVDYDEEIYVKESAWYTRYESEIYGRININTAPWYVIARLPWVTEELAQAIVAYRDKKSLVNPVHPGGGTKVAFPVIDYTGDKGRAQGMWDSVHTVNKGYVNTGEEQAAPFNVREAAGFKSIGELYNVTHGLRMEFPASLRSDNIQNTFLNNESASYQEVSVLDAPRAQLLGLAVGATYDNRFDIRRWGKKMLSIAMNPASGSTPFRLDYSEENSNPNGLWASPIKDSMPFYDGDPVDIKNDDTEKYAIFNKISNLITTRSDVFTAYILVRVGRDGPQRRMIGIFDRSNVYSGNDEVKLLALFQVPETQ